MEDVPGRVVLRLLVKQPLLTPSPWLNLFSKLQTSAGAVCQCKSFLRSHGYRRGAGTCRLYEVFYTVTGIVTCDRCGREYLRVPVLVFEHDQVLVNMNGRK